MRMHMHFTRMHSHKNTQVNEFEQPITLRKNRLQIDEDEMNCLLSQCTSHDSRVCVCKHDDDFFHHFRI